MIKKRKSAYRAHRTGKRLSTKSWRDSLVGTPAFIIGNAPSLANIDLKPLTKHFTIGINRAFYKLDPTILMWQDPEFWYAERHRVPKLKAIKYCRDKADIQGRFYHFKLKSGRFDLPETTEALHGRGSTGPLAFQLAWILGCNPIILLGMDCCYSDGKTDFYGKNPCHKPHTLRNCRRGLEWIKSSNHNRKVINCSENSVFSMCYTFQEALGMIDDARPQNRESLTARLSSGGGL